MNQGNRVKIITDPITGRPIAVPASRVLVRNTEPEMGRSSQPDRVMTARMRVQDMYARLPAADLVGARGPGVVPGGDQGRGARRGQAEQEGQPPPPHTYRPLGGAKQNFRGGSKILSPPSTGLGETVSVAGTIVQTPRDAGDDAELITVSLGLDFANASEDSPVVQQTETLCNIQWGIGGAIFNAQVDWMQGLIFSIPASFVNIGGVYRANILVGPATPPPLIFSAAISYGPHPNGVINQTRLTQLLGQINGTATTSVRVPRYATGFSIVTSSSTPDVTVTLQTNTTGVPLIDGTFIYNNAGPTGNQQSSMFSLLNSTRQINITNNAVGAIRASVIWNIGL